VYTETFRIKIQGKSMRPLEQRIAALEEQLKQQKAKAQKIAAAIQAKESGKARKLENRKRMLIGAMFLAQMNKNEDTKKSILAKLDGFLTKESERSVFGLIPKQSQSPASMP
jgi:transposase